LTLAMHASTLLFVRHGATELNLAGLRCGGDIDAPLVADGRRQARESAARLLAMGAAPTLIVTAPLLRTHESARLIGQAFPHAAIVLHAGFAERRLGAWNGLPIADTQHDLEDGVTPPGGESSAEFTRRIADALREAMPSLRAGALLVGSRGVARVMAELLALPRRLLLDNGEIARFDLHALQARLAPAEAVL
jgi:probable phosphoglycerate mutase